MGYKCFRSLIYQSTEPAVIVLEDLSASGFATLQAPEDYATSKMIFERLAVFHAASFYRLENVRKSLSATVETIISSSFNQGADYGSYDYSVYHMPDSIQESFFRHNLRIFKSLLAEDAWPELNKPEYIDRIDAMIEKCSARGRRVFEPAAGGFNVLNHGDFVLRNMLFRSIDGKICDVQFVSTKKESRKRTFFFPRSSYRLFSMLPSSWRT